MMKFNGALTTLKITRNTYIQVKVLTGVCWYLTGLGLHFSHGNRAILLSHLKKM